jgi:nucleotide-binding universal stress UspA family protein
VREELIVRVLLALDGTEASARASAFVERLLDDDDRELTTVHVRSSVPPEIHGWVAPGKTPQGAVFAPDVRERLHAERESLENASAQAPPDATMEVRYGDPAEVIIDAADQIDVDLIVVGSHDRSLIDRLFSGSVSSTVARDSPRPVLVVR